VQVALLLRVCNRFESYIKTEPQTKGKNGENRGGKRVLVNTWSGQQQQQEQQPQQQQQGAKSNLCDQLFTVFAFWVN